MSCAILALHTFVSCVFTGGFLVTSQPSCDDVSARALIRLTMNPCSVFDAPASGMCFIPDPGADVRPLCITRPAQTTNIFPTGLRPPGRSFGSCRGPERAFSVFIDCNKRLSGRLPVRVNHRPPLLLQGGGTPRSAIPVPSDDGDPVLCRLPRQVAPEVAALTVPLDDCDDARG